MLITASGGKCCAHRRSTSHSDPARPATGRRVTVSASTRRLSSTLTPHLRVKNLRRAGCGVGTARAACCGGPDSLCLCVLLFRLFVESTTQPRRSSTRKLPGYRSMATSNQYTHARRRVHNRDQCLQSSRSYCGYCKPKTPKHESENRGLSIICQDKPLFGPWPTPCVVRGAGSRAGGAHSRLAHSGSQSAHILEEGGATC